MINRLMQDTLSTTASNNCMVYVHNLNVQARLEHIGWLQCAIKTFFNITLLSRGGTRGGQREIYVKGIVQLFSPPVEYMHSTAK